MIIFLVFLGDELKDLNFLIIKEIPKYVKVMAKSEAYSCQFE
ncbi:MAG: hypothetical protein ACJAT2_003209 [Bacteriovoracaceae bacterium]|jgi:hypothetical protein